MLEKHLKVALCRCLAFHIVETELTLKFIDGPVPEIEEKVAEGRNLIAQAGFDFDTLYPVADRPVGQPLGRGSETIQ